MNTRRLTPFALLRKHWLARRLDALERDCAAVQEHMQLDLLLLASLRVQISNTRAELARIEGQP